MKDTQMIRVTKDIVAAMDVWIWAQTVPPTKTAVVDTALREFFQNHPVEISKQ